MNVIHLAILSLFLISCAESKTQIVPDGENACESSCTVGAVQCGADGVETCAAVAGSCPAWGPGVACLEFETCRSGACERTCAPQDRIATWIPVATGIAPSSRDKSALGFDTGRGEAVLFGGSSSGFLSDTWIWNGTAWTVRDVTGPAARTDHKLAYDELRMEVVLFGGRDLSTYFNDTWIWDGVMWSVRTVAGPEGRTGHAMATDHARGEVVLFGGQMAGLNNLSDETWVWDGTSWTQKMSQAPSPRVGLAMAYHSATQAVVLHGGNSPSSLYGDTWIWDGTNWQERNVISPSARWNHAMSMDATSGLVVLFGGDRRSPTFFVNDTWLWDGENWLQTLPEGAPPARVRHMLTYDSVQNKTMLFGGASMNDTWNLELPCP